MIGDMKKILFIIPVLVLLYACSQKKLTIADNSLSNFEIVIADGEDT